MSGKTPESNKESTGLSIIYQSNHIQIEAVPDYPGEYFVRFRRLRTSVLLNAAELLSLMDAGLLHAEWFRQEVEQAQEKGGDN